MHLPRIVVFAVALSMPVLVFAQAEKKAPWLWTDEERLAARFDPKANKDRVAASERCRQDSDPCKRRWVVDADRNPELVMPWELMHVLATAYHEGHGKHAKAMFAERGSVPLDDDFWHRLYGAGTPFFDAIVEEQRLFMNDDKSMPRAAFNARREALADDICRLLPAALHSARDTFGRDTFDRFLYEVIAFGPFSSDESDCAVAQRRKQAGCR